MEDCLPRPHLIGAFGGLDEMFEFAAPMALMRGHRQEQHVPGRVRPPGTYADKKGRQKYGINAGVMVLEPSRQEFQRMCEVVSQEDHPSHLTTNGPEQDFLTRHFIERWQCLHVRIQFPIDSALVLQGCPCRQIGFKNDRTHDETIMMCC